MTTTKIDYGRYYTRWHSDKPEHIQSRKSFYKQMLSEFLPSDKNISVLDVGCGMGFALITLQDMGYSNLEGIDIDEGQVFSCIQKGIRATKVDNSVSFLLDNQASYDLILALDVIEHIPYNQQLEFVKSINEALKPGGKIICTVPNANSGVASRWRYNDWTHHISFTEHSLDFLLFNSGFGEINIFETGYQPFRLSNWRTIKSIFKLRAIFFVLVRLLRRIEMIAELGFAEGKNIPLSLNILATARKPL
jgi:SAM-dependent methyltransferase